MASNQPVCLITGATSGIGLHTAVGMAKAGFITVIVGRNTEKCEAACTLIRQKSMSDSVYFMLADLSETRSVWKLAIDFRAQYNQLDVLINNAGGVNSKFEKTSDGIEKTFATNHLSYFLLTNLLLDLLQKAPQGRIVNVSSNSHFQGTMQFDSFKSNQGYFVLKAYAQSKLANVLFNKALATRLVGTRVTTNALHPGVVRTPIGQKGTESWMGWIWNFFAGIRGISAERGAQTSLYLALSPEVTGKSGGYYVKCKLYTPSAEAQNEALAEQLWAISEKLTGLK